VLKICRTPGPTACLKMLNKVCLKSWRREKNFHDWTWAALNLQPSDLCSNAYRSLQGGQMLQKAWKHVTAWLYESWASCKCSCFLQLLFYPNYICATFAIFSQRPLFLKLIGALADCLPCLWIISFSHSLWEKAERLMLYIFTGALLPH